MATYKLIQDIEAEDHILGPLSFRQFVFALIAVFFGYMTFIVITKHVAILALVFLPPALFFGFFALPFGKDQPTELWALAILRFWLKPRKRVWDQSGQKELVTINVPKVIEHIYTDGLNQTEVHSRLNALANTLDSRGWAVKNVGGATQPAIVANSDRLTGLNVQSQQVSDLDIRASDDVLDNNANPLARQFTDMIDASTQAHRQKLMEELDGIRAGQNTQAAAPPQTNWFMPAGSGQQNPTQSSAQPVNDYSQMQATSPAPAQAIRAVQTETPEQQAEIAQIEAEAAAVAQQQAAAYTNLRTMPVDNTGYVQNDAQQQDLSAVIGVTDSSAQQIASASTPDPAILNLANNNDLDIATLARQADKAKGDSPDEVVISLH